MCNPFKILLVDDDQFAAMLVIEMLSADYEILHVEDGQSALNAIAESPPELIILDVEMPGMSGYEVCRALRENTSVADIPVIFLSGKVSDEDRMAGYEAGGDDYLTKPVSAAEIRSKINHELANSTERRRLKADLSSAFTTAMTVMTSSAEIGTLFQFVRNSYNCGDYESLCREVINVLTQLGLEASVRIYGEQGSLSLSSSGPCSTLEESVLNNMAEQGRLFEFGSRISCSYQHITIIIKSDARADPERHGRMKDNLAWLAEGIDSRVAALDASAVMEMQNEKLAQLTATVHKALQEIDKTHREHGNLNNEIFQDLQDNFDQSMLSIGITQSQEDELAQLIIKAADKARNLHAEGLKISSHMGELLTKLESAGGK